MTSASAKILGFWNPYPFCQYFKKLYITLHWLIFRSPSSLSTDDIYRWSLVEVEGEEDEGGRAQEVDEQPPDRDSRHREVVRGLEGELAAVQPSHLHLRASHIIVCEEKCGCGIHVEEPIEKSLI